MGTVGSMAHVQEARAKPAKLKRSPDAKGVVTVRTLRAELMAVVDGLSLIDRALVRKGIDAHLTGGNDL